MISNNNIRQKIVFLVLMVFFTGFLHAQNDEIFSTSGYFNPPLIGKPYKASPIGKGTPFLVENWLNGNVYLTNGDTVKNRWLKFDCVKSELIWLADGKDVVAVDPSLILGFSLTPLNTNYLRVFQKVSMKSPLLEDTAIRYLEILSSGKVKLFASRKVGVSSEAVVGSKGGAYSLSVYTPEPFFLFQVGDLPVKYIKMRRKSIINAYAEHAVKIKSILRENHVGSVRSEFQLIEAVKILNSKW